MESIEIGAELLTLRLVEKFIGSTLGRLSNTDTPEPFGVRLVVEAEGQPSSAKGGLCNLRTASNRLDDGVTS